MFRMLGRHTIKGKQNGQGNLPWIAAAALGHPVSRQWKGYWQRSALGPALAKTGL